MPWSNESRQSRGYGAAWEQLRKKVIARAKGMCEECARQGRVAMGRDVDHKVSKAKARQMGWSDAQIDDDANLQYLCTTCHDEKTTRETGRIYRPKIVYGEDGWPVE